MKETTSDLLKNTIAGIVIVIATLVALCWVVIDSNRSTAAEKKPVVEEPRTPSVEVLTIEGHQWIFIDRRPVHHPDCPCGSK